MKRNSSGRTPKTTAPAIAPRFVPMPPKTSMQRIVIENGKPKSPAEMNVRNDA